MRFQIGWDAGMLPMHAVENKAAHKDWNRATMQKKKKEKWYHYGCDIKITNALTFTYQFLLSIQQLRWL